MKARRRWCAFSLRTLFVVVTLVGVWLGWQVSVVGQRLAMQREIEAHGGELHFGRASSDFASKPFFGTCRPLGDLPFTWRMLGTRRMALIVLPWNRWSAREAAAIRRLFPEAWLGQNVCLHGEPGAHDIDSQLHGNSIIKPPLADLE